MTFGEYHDEYHPQTPLHFEDTLRSLQRAGLTSWDSDEMTPVLVRGKHSGQEFNAAIKAIRPVDSSFGGQSGFILIELEDS